MHALVAALIVALVVALVTWCTCGCARVVVQAAQAVLGAGGKMIWKLTHDAVASTLPTYRMHFCLTVGAAVRARARARVCVCVCVCVFDR